MRSYQPEELFDEQGRFVPELAALAPKGDRRMGANPHANGGKLPRRSRSARLHRLCGRSVSKPATELQSRRASLARCCATSLRATPSANFRLFCPDETNSNRLGDVFEVENRCFVEAIIPIDDHMSPDGRVMEVLSEHNCHGWLEGYCPHRSARHVRHLRVVRHGLGLDDHAAQQVAGRGALKLPWRAPVAVAQHSADIDLLAQRPQRLQPPGPGLIERHALEEGHGLAHLSAARRELPALRRRPLLPQPQLCEPDRHRQAAAAAMADYGGGASSTARAALSIWEWAGNDGRRRAGRGAGLRRATCRRWRRWPPPGGCASTCPTSRCASSTSSTS